MPFKSRQQEKWMWATHPQMARQWEQHTPKSAKLPQKVGKENASKKRP